MQPAFPPQARVNPEKKVLLLTRDSHLIGRAEGKQLHKPPNIALKEQNNIYFFKTNKHTI